MISKGYCTSVGRNHYQSLHRLPKPKAYLERRTQCLLDARHHCLATRTRLWFLSSLNVTDTVKQTLHWNRCKARKEQSEKSCFSVPVQERTGGLTPTSKHSQTTHTPLRAFSQFEKNHPRLERGLFGVICWLVFAQLSDELEVVLQGLELSLVMFRG
jgi:hypothetical protein